MIVVLAFALMIVPLAVLYVLEKAAKNGRGPLADPAGAPVLDGMIMAPSLLSTVVSAVPVPEEPMDADPVFADPPDAVRCAEESRLVRGLLDGELDRAVYQTEMASLAARSGSQR